MLIFSEKDDSIIFSARIVPRASKSEIVGEVGGALKIRIASPPVDGAANAELIKLLSKTFSVSRNSVEILSGANAKIKQIKVSGLNSEAFSKLLKTDFPDKQ